MTPIQFSKSGLVAKTTIYTLFLFLVNQNNLKRAKNSYLKSSAPETPVPGISDKSLILNQLS
jgi:hypothetical protein